MASEQERTSRQFTRASSGQPEGYIPEPTVIPDGNTNSGRAWGLDSYLMHKSQTIFLTGPVSDESCVDVKKRLIYLDAKFPGKEITIYVDSPGGSVSSGDSVAAVMLSLRSPVKIIVAGDAASMGSVIASFGTPGMRFAMPGSMVMVHPPGYYGGGGPGGDSNEVGIHARVLKNMYTRGTSSYTAVMGLDPHNKDDLKLVKKLTERSTYLNATTAAKLGLIDDVIPIPERAMTPAKQILQDLIHEQDMKELAEIGDDQDEDLMAIVKLVIAKRDAYIKAEIDNPDGPHNPFLAYAVRKEKIALGLINPEAEAEAAEASVSLPGQNPGGPGTQPT